MSASRAVAAALVGVIVGAGGAAALLSGGGDAHRAEELRAVGSRLQGAGVRGEAADVYSRYLDLSDADGPTRANVALTAGGLLMDEGRYEQALSLFYQAELLAPGTEAAKEAGKQIVTCLERSGRGAAARSAMASRVSTDRLKAGADSGADDPIVARAGTIELRRSDYLTVLATLPPEAQARASEKDGQKELLTQALVMQALYEKAVARGLDKDEAVQRRLAALRRDLITSALVEEAAADRIRPSAQDLKNFYDAHADAFEGKTFDEAQAEVRARYLNSRLAELYPQLAGEALGSARVETFPQHLGGAAASPPAGAPEGAP